MFWQRARVFAQVSPDEVRLGEDDQDVTDQPKCAMASEATAASGDSAIKTKTKRAPIASMVEDAGCSGFFDLYRSADDGTVHLRIPANRLEEEMSILR